VSAVMIRPDFSSLAASRRHMAYMKPREVSALDPDELERVPGFRHLVAAEDPEFTRAAITPEVHRVFMTDPWLRVRHFLIYRGVLWVRRAARLTVADMRMSIGSPIRLAATIPAEAWRTFTPPLEAERFLARVRSPPAPRGPAPRGRPRRPPGAAIVALTCAVTPVRRETPNRLMFATEASWSRVSSV